MVFGLFVASDFLTAICHLAVVNVYVVIILSIGNTQISILLLCFLYLFVELMITVNEYNFVSTKYTVYKPVCVHFQARKFDRLGGSEGVEGVYGRNGSSDLASVVDSLSSVPLGPHCAHPQLWSRVKTRVPLFSSPRRVSLSD